MDRENRRLEHKIEIFKDPNGACQSIIALYSLDISNEKLDQILSVILSKLPKEDIESRQSGDAKVRLIKIRRPTYLTQHCEKTSILFMRHNQIVFSFLLT